MSYGEQQALAEPELAETPASRTPPPRKRRRFRIPFLMPLIFLGMLGALGTVWYLIPIPSEVVGTLTFLNFNWTPGTQDAIEMESAQRRYLQDTVRPVAIDTLKTISPGTSAGFLDVQDLYAKAASSIDFTGSDQSNPPKTLLTLHYNGADKEGDRLRMLAMLQALSIANAPLLDGNRRLHDAAQKAQRLVNDTQQKVDDLKANLTQVQAIIDGQPTIDDLTRLTSRKSDFERAKIDAEDALNRDNAEVARLQNFVPAVASSTTQPDVADDSQLSQMRQELADLSAEADSARSDQVTAAVLARRQLETAAKDFNDQIASANAVLDSGSQLRQFVDSAMDTQSKARDLINMLIVDGEDLEEQLEDTRRQMDDMIESRQAEIWAADTPLSELRDKLQSAQHRYNANVGQGINDPRILDPIQHDIDTITAQIKDRQAQLGVDPSAIKVQESINHVIVSLRNKLAKEKQQIDQALSPLEQQLANLDPLVSAMPQAQQDLAHLIRQRLDSLNDARTKYAKTVGDEDISPSAKVADLQTRIADLKSRIASRRIELANAQAAARDSQHQSQLATAQSSVAQDQKNLDAATKALETASATFEDTHARHETAISAEQKKIALLDDQRTAFTDLENAKRDRDEKQSSADHAFDIAAVTGDDVKAAGPSDPRIMYTAFILGGTVIALALLTYVSHAQNRADREEAASAADRQEFHNPDELNPNDLNLDLPDSPPHGMFR